MAKLEDFLEVRFSDEIYEQFTIDFICQSVKHTHHKVWV